MDKNDIIPLKITALSSEGSGIGRYDGIAVFVPFSAVGDKLLVHILKVKKNYAYGKIHEIISPSKDRIENACPVFRKCGGCAYRHIDYKKECEAKSEIVFNNLKRIGGCKGFSFEEILSDSDTRYRNKAQYPIEADGKDLKIGFYSPRSHRVNDCEDCALQPKEYKDILKTVREFLSVYKISVYNEQSKKGLVRHIYIRKAEKTEQIMVVLVINGNALPHSDELISALKKLLGEELKSVQLNVNLKDTNVILGNTNKLLYGEPYITDEILGVKLRISPLSFYQVNRTMAEKLYTKAAEYAESDGKTVLDLYCGTGSIGLTMAKNAKKIIGVEIIPQAVEDAKINAELNGIKNAEFICADAADAAKQLNKKGIKPEVIIVDPPRKGCDAALLDTIANGFGPKRIVYVSCDSATLSRDCKILEEKGYKLKKATPADLFPRTVHVETVALLVRTVSAI